MSEPPRIKRNALAVLLAVVAAAVLLAWRGGRPSQRVGARTAPDYPQLFAEAGACPRRGDALANGRRSEELGRLRADRYAYDPRDGVRAVQRYQEAAACYRVAGARREVSRAQRASATLIARVDTDYAAARLNLANALEQKRWSAALSEVHRLLLLTDHVRRHEYVEWLEKILGRVRARASTAP